MISKFVQLTINGTLMIWQAFKHPIPKADKVVEADKKESKEVQEMDIT